MNLLFCSVELSGLEPKTTEPKSAVLPLHHSSIVPKSDRKYTTYFVFCKFCRSQNIYCCINNINTLLR